jgi:hypothetical protein
MKTFYIQYDLEYHNYPKFIVVKANTLQEAMNVIEFQLKLKDLDVDQEFICKNTMEIFGNVIFLGDW